MSYRYIEQGYRQVPAWKCPSDIFTSYIQCSPHWTRKGEFAISITSMSRSQDILTVPLEDCVLLLLHLNDNVARLLPRLVVSLPVENFPESFNFENWELENWLPARRKLSWKFLILKIVDITVFINPFLESWIDFEFTWNHLGSLCRARSLSPSSPLSSSCPCSPYTCNIYGRVRFEVQS